MQKVFTVAVDIGRKLPAPAFEVNTNDLKSVKLLITITNGQTLLDLTDTTVRIAIRKPDNNIVFQDCTIKDAKTGQVEIVLENQAYIMAGTHTAEIMCYKGSEVVAVSGTFSYKSTKGIMNDEAVESKSEFTTITGMLKDVQDTIKDVRENGTGIDTKARQDIQSVTTQLADTANDLKTRDINVMYPPPPLVGAKGNRTNDDTNAIIGCISYLNGKGGVIRFPVGTFRFTSKILVPDGVNLVGSGMRESHAGNTTNRPTSLLKDGNFEGIELWSSSSLSDMCVDGHTGNGGIGVRFMGNKARLENVIVSRMGGDGIVIGHPTIEGNRNAWIMKNVASVSHEGNGIVIDDYDPGYGPDANAGLAERTNAWANKGDGWVIGRCAVNTFLQCYGEENLGVGFRVKSTAMRNSFLNCGSERNGIEQFIFEEGSYNNLLFGAQEFIATDNGGNTVIRNTGGANQAFTVSRIIKSGKATDITTSIEAGLQMSANVPGIIFNELDAATNEKTWDIIANNGLLQLRALDDDGKNPSTIAYFDRQGKTLMISRFHSIVSALNGIGVGNSVAATTPGAVVRKMQVFDVNGNSIGFVPIYDSIT